jgi:hypothetical protein
MIEATLHKIAEHILSLDEASLSGLWEKYKARMEHFEASPEWEKSVIIFFMINAVRAKNHIFNEQILKRHPHAAEPGVPLQPTRGKPDLRRIK